MELSQKGAYRATVGTGRAQEGGATNSAPNTSTAPTATDSRAAPATHNVSPTRMRMTVASAAARCTIPPSAARAEHVVHMAVTSAYAAALAGVAPGGVLFDVPFLVQTESLNCGPTALAMGLGFLLGGAAPDPDELSRAVMDLPTAGVSTVKLVVQAAKMGYRVRFHTTSLAFNPDNMSLPFYQAYQDVDASQQGVLVDLARSLGADLREESVELDAVLAGVTPDSVVVVLLDWAVVAGSAASYSGHFVPVVGFDREFVYVHNQDSARPHAFLAVPRDRFDRARKAVGTDEDFLVVWRPVP